MKAKDEQRTNRPSKEESNERITDAATALVKETFNRAFRPAKNPS
jgi:hypothetical protein